MSTLTPTPHTTPTGVRTGGTVGGLLDHIPAGWLSTGIIILLLVGAAMELEHKRNRGTRQITRAVNRAVGGKTRGQRQDEAVGRFLRAVFGALWRFLTGREMSGRPASNATFWRRGRRPLSRILRRDPAAVQLGTVAIPERPLPAVYTGPSVAVERWRGWSTQHPVPGALGGAVRRGGTAVVWTTATGRASLRGVSAAGGGMRRTLREWGTWPYACRAAVRLAVLGALLGLWLHHFGTLVALVVVLVVGVLLAATGPAGLRLWRGVPRGDDHLYGPRLWAALRVVLDLKDEEYHDAHLLLPADLSADGAEIRLLLPDHYAATETERQGLDHLVNTRVPGEWVSRFHMMAAPPVAIWTHKPKPKPKPSCPDFVDFFDPEIQAAIRACAKGEVVLGRDEHNRIVIRCFGGETGHWGLSVGSGGGKSAFNGMVIAQLIAQGFHIVLVDIKRVSLAYYLDVPGVHIYNDPMSAFDMREAIDWVVDEMEARAAVMEVDENREFPGLLCIIEEGNETAVILRKWWDANRKPTTDKDGPADSAADPIWERVTTGARLGRQMSAHMLLVGQDFRDQAYGGKGMRNAFPLKLMGNFTAQQWKNVIDTTPVPDSYTKAGRMMLVESGVQQGWVQTPYGAPAALRAWVLAERERTGFDPTAGLFGAPPARSEKQLPKLLRRASRDKLSEATWAALEGGVADSAAGDGVTSRRHDAARDGLIPGQRDASEQGPSEADRHGLAQVYTDLLARREVEAGEVADAAPAPGAGILATIGDPNERLPLAEISRRLEMRGIHIPDNTMRQHKKRGGVGGRTFPAGVEVVGKGTLYTMAEIVQFYQPEILKNWGREAGESG